MAVLRTIFALVVAVSVAMLPTAGMAAFKLALQQSADVSEHADMSAQTSADAPTHDCCPAAANPCDRAGGDCASMATCALPCCVYPAGTASALVYAAVHADVMPLFGFYLQPAVGGRVLGYSFWRAFAEIENVWAVKIAPFNRYRTLDAVRGIAESGREDIALYTGNDDNIVGDLVTPLPATVNGAPVTRRIVGGLLGQWAMWTRSAVSMLDRLKKLSDSAIPGMPRRPSADA